MVFKESILIKIKVFIKKLNLGHKTEEGQVIERPIQRNHNNSAKTYLEMVTEYIIN